MKRSPLKPKPRRRKAAKAKTCPGCGRDFVPRPMQKFCSHSCAATVNARRVTRPGKCSVCGVAIEDVGPPSARKVTCGSRACRGEAIARAKRGARNPNYLGDARGIDRWNTARGKVCACCGKKGRIHLHHVIFEQEVRRSGGDVYDPRNALNLRIECHTSHHKRATVVPMVRLRDENFEFALELLGAGKAYEYLLRHYKPSDPRWEALLAPDPHMALAGLRSARERAL